MSGGDERLPELVERAAHLEKWALGRLVRVFEDSRQDSIGARAAVLTQLSGIGLGQQATVFGITGTPGAGKSTLVGEVATRMVAAREEASVAVLAVDPTSHQSGGAMLGDRTRVRFPLEERRLFFRSQASERELGGIGRATYQVVRLLERLFRYVIVETVGIGQSEIEIERLADRVYLVLQPMGGDQVQFMKAGIMEVPDVFVLNKADVGEAARQSYHALRASIDFARPGGGEPPPIIQTSAVTGAGVDELAGDMAAHDAIGDAERRMERERYFFEKWVRDEYGRLGLELLAEQGGAAALVAKAGSFEAAQARYRGPTG